MPVPTEPEGAWTFAGELWLGTAGETWTFVTAPPDVSEEIRDLSGPRRGFGSVRVRAKLGNTQWRTSVFPEAKSGCYVLPVKRSVRDAEQVEAPDEVTVTISLAEQARAIEIPAGEGP
jgi:hypothetical protein